MLEGSSTPFLFLSWRAPRSRRRGFALICALQVQGNAEHLRVCASVFGHVTDPAFAACQLLPAGQRHTIEFQSFRTPLRSRPYTVAPAGSRWAATPSARALTESPGSSGAGAAPMSGAVAAAVRAAAHSHLVIDDRLSTKSRLGGTPSKALIISLF